MDVYFSKVNKLPTYDTSTLGLFLVQCSTVHIFKDMCTADHFKSCVHFSKVYKVPYDTTILVLFLVHNVVHIFKDICTADHVKSRLEQIFFRRRRDMFSCHKQSCPRICQIL